MPNRKADDRRHAIRQIIQLTGECAPKELRRILSDDLQIHVSYQTVIRDIATIREHDSRWLSDTLKTSWNATLFEIYGKKKKALHQLAELRDAVVDDPSIAPKDKLGKIAFANKIINEMEQGLSDFMESKSLYAQVNEYMNRGQEDQSAQVTADLQQMLAETKQQADDDMR